MIRFLVCLLLITSSVFCAEESMIEKKSIEIQRVLTEVQKERLRVLDEISYAFSTQYAPILWKQEALGWDYEKELQAVREQITENPEMTQQAFHRLLSQLFHSTRDYHTSIHFLSNAYATLPIQVKGVQNRYYIVGIDRKKAPFASFPFNEGDQLVTMNGRPVRKWIEELMLDPCDGENAVTDEALAEIKLTHRSGATGDILPKGTVDLEIQPMGQTRTFKTQLAWDERGSFVRQIFERGQGEAFTHLFPRMEVDLFGQPNEEMSHKIGNKKGFLPTLGRVLWENDKDSSLRAYIYMNEEKQVIGFLRLPSFRSEDTKEITGILAKFSALTDGCIIDTTNNFGGYLQYTVAVLSMLSDEALELPKQRVALTQKMVHEAKLLLEYMEVPGLVSKLWEKVWMGYPLTYNFELFMKNYCKFIIEQWDSGKKLTDYFHFAGIDAVLPHPVVKYTKPLLVLVNELDFSCADLFPAILQDNGRATIMGRTTAGAGGYILSHSFPNAAGIDGFMLTGSILKRKNGEPIENLGVTPDIEYIPSGLDYQSGHLFYAQKVNAQIKEMIRGESSEDNGW